MGWFMGASQEKPVFLGNFPNFSKFLMILVKYGLDYGLDYGLVYGCLPGKTHVFGKFS